MKRLLFTLMIFLLSIPATHSQDSLQTKTFFCHFVLKPLHSRTVKGFLTSLNDSTLTWSSSRKKFSFAAHPGASEKKISYAEIEKVSIHFGNTAKQVLIPAGIGLALGGIVGFFSGDDDSNEFVSLSAGEKGLALGLFGFAVGAIVGGINVATSHKKFIVEGDRRKFSEMYMVFRARFYSGPD